MKLDDLYRYCAPVSHGRDSVARPWTHTLPSGLPITVATNGHAALVLAGRVAGAEAASPDVTADGWVDKLFAPRTTYDRHASMGLLRQWAGSPRWPEEPPQLCRACGGKGEIGCDLWDAQKEQCSIRVGARNAKCEHIDDWRAACDGSIPCQSCAGPDSFDCHNEGWLGARLVNRWLLARLLEGLGGPVVRVLYGEADEQHQIGPIFLSGTPAQRRWAVLMPMRDGPGDRRRPRFSLLPRR
ncbi:MAG: hypothetical protein AB1578_23195 [Thermodesulfobacteriota bacterium]